MKQLLFTIIFFTQIICNAAISTSHSKLHGQWEITRIYMDGNWKTKKTNIVINIDIPKRKLNVSQNNKLLIKNLFVRQQFDFYTQTEIMWQLLGTKNNKELYYAYSKENKDIEQIELFYYDSVHNRQTVAYAKRSKLINPFIVDRRIELLDLSEDIQQKTNGQYKNKTITLHAINRDRRYNTFTLLVNGDSTEQFINLYINLDEVTNSIEVKSSSNEFESYYLAKEKTNLKQATELGNLLQSAVNYSYINANSLKLYDNKRSYLCTISWQKNSLIY
jgi:hypothetical protein